jgi:hypothetical protein
VTLFYSYAHEDKEWLEALKKHLSPLRRRALIDEFDDRHIEAGEEWEKRIERHLTAADVILLLVSPDFTNSYYCWKETEQALRRHHNNEARVIPIIVRDVDWKQLPIAELGVLPTDGQAVLSAVWKTTDEAFLVVAAEVGKVVKGLLERRRDA